MDDDGNSPGTGINVCLSNGASLVSGESVAFACRTTDIKADHAAINEVVDDRLDHLELETSIFMHGREGGRHEPLDRNFHGLIRMGISHW